MIREAWIKFQNNQFFKFVFVGILNTFVGYFSFAVLILVGLHYVLALTLSSIIGITHSYFWNKYFTFKSYKKNFIEFMRFVSVYAMIFVLNLGLLYIFVDIFGFGVIVVQGVVLACVTVSSFLGHKFWSFR